MSMILVMAFLDMLGVASILPFMAVLANPDQVQTNTFLKTIFIISNQVGVQTTEQFFLGVVFVLLIDLLPSRHLLPTLKLAFH